MRDCNTCKHHVQGAHPAYVDPCASCLFNVDGTINNDLPKWEPIVFKTTGKFAPCQKHAFEEPMTEEEEAIPAQLFELDPTHVHAFQQAFDNAFAYVDTERPAGTRPEDILKVGVKFDADKVPLHLLDRTALEEIAKVLGFGAKKYAAHNWRKGIQHTRLLRAGISHLLAYLDGEDLDPETGLTHVAHAGCCVMFLLNLIKTRPDLDDRYKKENV